MKAVLSQVPAELHQRFREITSVTDKFCAAHLDGEYRDLCRACAADACAARLPVDSGKAAGWAAGVISAVAHANFLTSDPERPYHMSPGDLARGIGVSPATMQSKSKAIRDALHIDRLDTRFITEELRKNNPLDELMALMGQLMSARTGPSRPRPAKRKRDTAAGPPRIYTLDVSLLNGPITREFARKNRSVVRTIEIRGDQTLDDLHEEIFDAFDRDDPHMYEFQFGKKPMDPKGPRYVMPEALEYGDDMDPPAAGITTETTIDDLGLKVGRHFGSWFDFGDDWHHQIDVVAITEGPAKGKYPRVTKRIGESPPQYIDWEEEE